MKTKKDGSTDGMLIASDVVPTTESCQVNRGDCSDITRRQETEQTLALQSQRLQILHEIDQAVLAAHSPTEIARAAVRRIRQLVPCQCADVAVFDTASGQVTWLAVDAAAQTCVVPGLQAPLADYPVVPAVPGNEQIVTDLTAQAPRLPIEELMLAAGMRTYTSLPLVTGEQVIGVLNLWQDVPGGIAPELIEMARQVADSLAVAIQNDRANHEVHAGHQELKNLSRRLVEMQENERRYISRELHDEAGQALTTLMVGLKLLERDLGRCTPEVEADLEDLKQVAGAVMENQQGLAVYLRPTSLDKLGLVPALRQLVAQFKRQSNVVLETDLAALEGVRLPPSVETTLYRIVQEALANIARHARASNAGIVLSRYRDHVTVIVEDDGVGFDALDAVDAGRLGLVGMRERAEMLGGALTIESMPGAGTSIFIDIPCTSWQT
jgi:signal transduction histidine kinase